MIVILPAALITYLEALFESFTIRYLPKNYS